MNSKQNEIVEKLIGASLDAPNQSHGFGNFTETEVYKLTNINPTPKQLVIINAFCRAKSAEDIKNINTGLASFRGSNIKLREETMNLLNKIRHKFKNQIPANIRMSKVIIQWKEDDEASIENAHELTEMSAEDKKVNKTIEPPRVVEEGEKHKKKDDSDKNIPIIDKVPKDESFDSSKNVDTNKVPAIPKFPTNLLASKNERDEESKNASNNKNDVDKVQNAEIDALKKEVDKTKEQLEQLEDNMLTSEFKPTTDEEKKKIKEFKEKHVKEQAKAALNEIVDAINNKKVFESIYGENNDYRMDSRVDDMKEPLTDKEKAKVKEKLTEHNKKTEQIRENKEATADFQHEHNLLNKTFKNMKRIEDIPFDKEAFNRNLDAIQMVVNLIKRENITDKNKINKMITPYITGKWIDVKGGRVVKQDLSYRIPNEVRAAHRKYIKQKIDEILAQINCHINIEPLDKKSKRGSNLEGTSKIYSGAEGAIRYRELKGMKPEKVNDEETFFVYDINSIYTIIENFIKHKISKKYKMSDEAKTNINSLINNETKFLKNEQHGTNDAIINSKFINELAKPIDNYINSKINRTAIANSKNLSADEKLKHMRKFHLSPITKMKLEKILLKDTADLHVDVKEDKEEKHGISKMINSYSYIL